MCMFCDATQMQHQIKHAKRDAMLSWLKLRFEIVYYFLLFKMLKFNHKYATSVLTGDTRKIFVSNIKSNQYTSPTWWAFC